MQNCWRRNTLIVLDEKWPNSHTHTHTNGQIRRKFAEEKKKKRTKSLKRHFFQPLDYFMIATAFIRWKRSIARRIGVEFICIYLYMSRIQFGTENCDERWTRTTSALPFCTLRNSSLNLNPHDQRNSFMVAE